MPRVDAAAAVCLLLAAAPVRAQSGLNLSWDDCGVFGVVNKSFACDTNADSSVAVLSFQAGPVPFNCLLGMNGYLDLQVAAPSLPNWWQFKNLDSCRERSLRITAEYPFGPLNCHDPWLGCGVAGIHSYIAGNGGPNRARIITSVGMPCAVCLPVLEGVETYVHNLIIRHDRTTGPQSCDGCPTEACIVFNTLVINIGWPERIEISAPLARNYVTWQGGTGDCPGATPTKNRSWGAVKSIYR